MTWLRAQWDRVAAVVLIAAGVVAVALAFNAVNDSPYVGDQLSYIASGGLGGMFLMGCGISLLISSDLHDEWRTLHRLELAIRGEGADLEGNSDGTSSLNRARALALLASGPVAAEAEGERPSDLRPRVALVAAVPLAVAVALLVAGWRRASASNDPAHAVDGLAWALVGLMIVLAAALGAAAWLKWEVRRRQQRALSPLALAEIAAAAAPLAEAVAEDRVGARRQEAVFVAPGRTRYHRAGCPALAGLDAQPVARAKVPRGMSPCGICEAPS